MSKASNPGKAAGTAQLRVLWRCHGCGMPRIDSSCPLCGRTQEFTFVRCHKLDENGLAALVSELQATKKLAEVKLRHTVAQAPASPLEMGSSADAGANLRASDSGAAVTLQESRDIREVALGLVADLTAMGRDLARRKALTQTSAGHPTSNAGLRGARPIKVCLACKRAAPVNKAGICDYCLLARGCRRCADCGMPTLPQQFDLAGKCVKCQGRRRSRSVRPDSASSAFG